MHICPEHPDLWQSLSSSHAPPIECPQKPTGLVSSQAVVHKTAMQAPSSHPQLVPSRCTRTSSALATILPDWGSAAAAHEHHQPGRSPTKVYDWLKIDFIIRKNRRFSVPEFGRRTPANLLGCDVFVATAEDTIVAKLDWARDSGSERQLLDVVSILAVSGEQLDLGYVEKWVADLGLEELWVQVRNG